MANKRNEDELPLIRNAKTPEDWRMNREVRFTWRQQRKREWIAFREIAEWFAELDGHGMPNEVRRANAYDMLQRDLLNGDFEEAGRSRVLYWHFRTTMAKMTRQRLQAAIDTHPIETVRSEYLGRCWLPRSMFQRWLDKHELPLSPARFREVAAGNIVVDAALFSGSVDHKAEVVISPTAESDIGKISSPLTRSPMPNAPRRGRRPVKLERVKDAMRRDIKEGRQSVGGLRTMLEKNLAGAYAVSRETARNARKAVLSEFVENSISTNDK